MLRAACVLACVVLSASLARGAEPVRINLNRVSDPYVMDGGRTVFVVSRNDRSGSFWATVDATSGKVVRRADVPLVELRGAAFAAGAPGVVIMFGKRELPGGGGGGGGGDTAPRDGVGYLAAWDDPLVAVSVSDVSPPPPPPPPQAGRATACIVSSNATIS